MRTTSADDEMPLTLSAAIRVCKRLARQFTAARNPRHDGRPWGRKRSPEIQAFRSRIAASDAMDVRCTRH